MKTPCHGFESNVNRRLGYARAIAACLVMACAAASHSLEIVITEGWDSPTRIAVVPFGGAPLRDRPGPVAPVEVADVVSFDLMRSGQFDALSSEHMLSNPTVADEVSFRDWKISLVPEPGRPVHWDAIRLALFRATGSAL